MTKFGQMGKATEKLVKELIESGANNDKTLDISKVVEPTMTKTDLKPCPFCGGVDLHICRADDIQDGDVFYVNCYECGCICGTEPSEPDAIAAWNRRSPEPSEEQKQNVAHAMREQDKYIMYLKGKLLEVEQVRDKAWEDWHGKSQAAFMLSRHNKDIHGKYSKALTRILDGDDK